MKRTVKKRAEIRVVVCKKCGCSIDDSGLCGYECELDDTPISARPSDSLETQIYKFDRVEN